MWWNKWNYVNGDIYDFKALKTSLLKKGKQFNKELQIPKSFWKRRYKESPLSL